MEESNVTPIVGESREADPAITEAREAEKMRKEKARVLMFEERSRMMQAWEDLTAEMIPSRLVADEIDDGLRFRVEVKGGAVQTVYEIAEKRDLVASIGGLGGVTMKPRRES